MCEKYVIFIEKLLNAPDLFSSGDRGLSRPRRTPPLPIENSCLEAFIFLLIIEKSYERIIVSVLFGYQN